MGEIAFRAINLTPCPSPKGEGQLFLSAVMKRQPHPSVPSPKGEGRQEEQFRADKAGLVPTNTALAGAINLTPNPSPKGEGGSSFCQR